ncbi:isoprenylcysteine carboxylmethyltransferase family protein [Oscillatoria sp. CS-180]|uniref:methyltransferase family protein n=1 Tax=Oscillatoria sp. CS-180 TaxID=3021720 RepID=UPI00232E8940|nr:isoprenylcysteine carboxylmethyltransferase family protein [Oscillatoria sp. CS-180]MDB9529771.1 isoprenylcysteine carboxylmethyltransferase family protein [Oscillatoria sp. CS-180]
MNLKVPPVAVIVVFAALMVAVTRLLPGLTWLVPGRLVIAIVLTLLGGAISLAGVAAFRRHQTTVNPMVPAAATTIVSTGLYRFTRNPMYVGFVLGLMGWATFLSNVGAVLLVLVCVLYLTQFQIKPEEQALLQRFGSLFADYMASVRRWL